MNKPRNAVPSDRQVTFLVPKIGTQNETLDSDIEEGCWGGLLQCIKACLDNSEIKNKDGDEKFEFHHNDSIQ